MLIVLLGITTSCKKKKPIGIAELRKITMKRDLHLVEYRYHDMIFLYKKDNPDKKLRMIVKYPVSISAYVDLKQMLIDSIKGIVTIPQPELGKTNIEFAKAEFISIRDGLSISLGGAREKTLKLLKTRMEESERRIMDNAIELGIYKQARTETETFIKGLLSYLNKENQYEVKFTKVKAATAPLESFDSQTRRTSNEIYIEIDDELDRIIGK